MQSLCVFWPSLHSGRKSDFTTGLHLVFHTFKIRLRLVLPKFGLSFDPIDVKPNGNDFSKFSVYIFARGIARFPFTRLICFLLM